MNLSDVAKFIEPALAGRGLKPEDVSYVVFQPEMWWVEYFVRDSTGAITVDALNPDEPHTATSYFHYDDFWTY